MPWTELTSRFLTEPTVNTMWYWCHNRQIRWWNRTDWRGMVLLWSPGELACIHRATQTKAWTTADLCPSRTPMILLGGRLVRELLRGRGPLASLCLLGGVQEIVSQRLLGSHEIWDFLPCPPQNTAADYKTAQLKSRFGCLATGSLRLILSPTGPFCLGVVLCGVWDKDREELALLAILLFTVYVRDKWSGSNLGTLSVELVRLCPPCLVGTWQESKNKPTHR